MKKWFFILSLLLLNQPVSWSLEKEKSFSFGSNVFQFEEPKSYYSNEDDPFAWQKLYFIRDGQKIELFKNDSTYLGLIKPQNISKNGDYFMINRLRYGYLDDGVNPIHYIDREYCTFVKTENGCVVYEDSWYLRCAGAWSQKKDGVWVFDAGSVNEKEIVEWNLDDVFQQLLYDNNDELMNDVGGELNAKLCRGEPIQNIVHGPFKTDLYPQGEIYFEKNDGRYGPIQFILSAEDEQGGIIDEVIDQYEHNGSDVNIESVFFYPIDGEKNIFVIVSWNSNHQAEGVHDKFYEVHSYYKDNDGALISNQKVGSDLNLKGFDGENENGKSLFTYKTALDVKKYITENY